ncbi:MAG: hypothetical protein U9P82_06650 [Bacteroidota bacterium]|nr:hypothetical protein [Bacteroidota bacterium]
MGEPLSIKSYKIQTDFPEIYQLDITNDTLFLFLESGIFYYTQAIDSFKIYKNKFLGQEKLKFLLAEQGKPWIYNQQQWKCLKADKPWSNFEESLLKLFDDINAINTDSQNNLWVINNNNQIHKIAQNISFKSKPAFNVYFKSITNDKGLSFELSDIVFEPDNKAIYVDIIAPSYLKN